jgi:hypothetical protein
MYYHGESINVNVVVTNNSNKTLRKIRISGTNKNSLFHLHLNPKKTISNKTPSQCSCPECRNLFIFINTV